jgi:tetratricopeptide (TPR) repeat protein
MRRIGIVSSVLLIICIITTAQDNPELNSMRAEILKRLNDKSLEFSFVDYKYNDHWMRPIKITVPVTFRKNQLYLKTNRGEKSVSFNDTIKYVEAYNYTAISIGDSLQISRTGRNKGLLKNDYILFKDYQNKKIKEEFDIMLANFQKVVSDYSAKSEKPVQTEEQRKYIVQANSFNQGKNYLKAIDLYEKAVSLDPVSYPAAYYNLALLHAQIGNYRNAVLNMKKYLLLVPAAPDARSAKDKIYEWEIK